MSTLFSLADFRQALRRLARERGFSATVLLTLALCIGANVTIYAVVDAILVRSLPFPDADRLVTASKIYPGAGVSRSGISIANYVDWRQSITAFSSMAVIQAGAAIVGEPGNPSRIQRDRVSTQFFSTLGVPLAMGREFQEAELSPANSHVAILTDEYWRNNFAADSNVLGRKFQVDGAPFTIVGVLPAGFHYLTSRAQFFVPLSWRPAETTIDNRHTNRIWLVARLAPGATLTSAGAQITAFDTHQLESEPNAVFLMSAHYAAVLQFLHEDQVREIRPVLLLLQGGVLLLLCIGGVNLVNLLLIRASGRAKELAVRRALGAQGKHIAREVVLETTLLAVGGGALGLGFGAVGIRLLTALGRALLPVGAVIEFDLRVALIALAGSAIVGVALALPVVWFNLRDNLAPVLQATTRGGTVNGAAQRLRHAFIIAQVALAFVLLASAGLLGLSLRRVLATGPGFQTEHILTGQIFLSGARYAKAEQRLAFSERLLGELRSMPGVASVGITSGLPFTRDVSRIDTAVEGLEISAANSLRAHYSSAPLGDYWSALGIPLIAGRLLESGDNQRLPRACVVDADVANRYWPKQDPLGRRLSIGGAFDPADCYTVVGVVGSIKQNDLTDASAQGAIYYPYLPFTATGYPTSTLAIVVRAAGAQDVYASLIKQAVLKLDPEIPLDDVKNMQTRLEDSVVARRSPAVLTEIFAGVALLLAAVGTYGVLAYAVGQCRREIGIRMALGALPGQVRAQFLGLGARLFGAGIALGVLGAWVAGRALQGQLYGVGAVNLAVFAGAGAVMAVVVLLAVLLPSHRASLISPLEVLRGE